MSLNLNKAREKISEAEKTISVGCTSIKQIKKIKELFRPLILQDTIEMFEHFERRFYEKSLTFISFYFYKHEYKNNFLRVTYSADREHFKKEYKNSRFYQIFDYERFLDFIGYKAKPKGIKTKIF